MFTKCNILEIADFLASQPVTIEKDAEIYTFRLIDKNEFELELYISVYDKIVVIRLTQKNLSAPIYDIPYSDVDSIEIKNNRLCLFTKGMVVSLLIKPNFSLQYKEGIV